MKKLICFLLILSTMLTCSMAAFAIGGMTAFSPVRTYKEGMFSDVTETDWYRDSVAYVYELGLMNPVSESSFDVSGQVTMTQVIAIAARIHRIYTTGKDDFKQGRIWYDTYVRYALEQGIISSRFGCKKPATRAQMIDAFSRALPSRELAEINSVEDDSIPDVKMGSEYAAGIYKMYRAGVVTGSSERGTFYPSSGVSRAEVAAVAARMIDPDLRKSITLAYSGPDLDELDREDDDYFADAAILGNSLVDGLRIYSKLASPDYFCATSVSVVSAMNSKTQTLSNGSSGTLVQALCQKQYGKIYIELGINEIGYDVDYFISLYSEMLDTIITAEPNADIYIMSLLPVTMSKSSVSGTVFNMSRIKKYNEALYDLAKEKKCYYMDLCSALAGDDGYLPESWASDGVHLKPEYYSLWEECIRTHYA